MRKIDFHIPNGGIKTVFVGLVITALAFGTMLTGCSRTSAETPTGAFRALPPIPAIENMSVSTPLDGQTTLKNLWTVTEGITVRLLQDAYRPGVSRMTLVLENRSDSVMSYGNGWSFERYENGVWKSLEAKANYDFTLEGYTLYDHDKATFTIYTGFLENPLKAGTYRVTGCSLRVAPDDSNLSYGMDNVDYPPYQLEFKVTKNAAAEPKAKQDEALPEWTLPTIEEWQWYTPWECGNMYSTSGMQWWQYVQGENGLMAILYREDTPENAYLNIGDQLMMDLVDRKTGKRYAVFAEPTVETQKVTAYRDGFRVDCGELYYCVVQDDDTVSLTALKA